MEFGQALFRIPGAMPVMVNSVRDDTDASPLQISEMYVAAKDMSNLDRPIFRRPSNLFVYKPQSVNQDAPLDSTYP